MRVKAGTDAHYALVAAESRSLPSEFFDGMPDSVRFLYRSTRRAIDDLITAGLIVHDGAGAYGGRTAGYMLTDEGHRALQRITDTGHYDTVPD